MLDGYPRNVEQAATLAALLADTPHNGVDCVLFLDVAEDALVERLSNRRACPNCGANFHLIFKAPADGVHCDRCGTELIQREDDREDVVRERLQIYRDVTQPLVAHYDAEGLLVSVDGSGTIEDVWNRVDAAVAQAVRA